MSDSVERKRIRVTLTRSVRGRLANHQACVRGLGLRRIHQSAEVENTESVRGMIAKVAYLVKVEEL